ncbi:hypothetical protein HDU98_007294 [Podochytrium sp. JEL0797]|nr:hypothetical protein HDU98_007294 [Podochytrium sp. JEL0797]
MTRDELAAENQALFEEMTAMEIQHEQTLTAAVDALEKISKERRALERQVTDLHTSKDLLEKEKDELKRERDHLVLEIQDLKKESQSTASKNIQSLKEREAMKTQLIAIELETAKLLDFLIEEGRILEQDEAAREGTDTEEEEGSLLELKAKLDASSSSSSLQKNPFMPQFTKPGKGGKKLGGSGKLGQTSSSLSTLYATAIAGAGTIGLSHNRLVVASNASLNSSNASLSSIDSLTAIKSNDSLGPADAGAALGGERRRRTSSVSHLRLSVCSLSKLSEGNKLPSSLSNLDARILAQIAQIMDLLKAVLALQEETGKQLLDSKKRGRVLECQVQVLGEWKDAVMKRVGRENVDKVPGVKLIENPREAKDPMDSTRELAKRLDKVKFSFPLFCL